MFLTLPNYITNQIIFFLEFKKYYVKKPTILPITDMPCFPNWTFHALIIVIYRCKISHDVLTELNKYKLQKAESTMMIARWAFIPLH